MDGFSSERVLCLICCSDSRPEAVRDREGQAVAGGENPSGGRRGEGLPAVIPRREGREAPQGVAVLLVHHRWPHRRHALHIHREDRLPERPGAGADLPQRRHGAGAVQGRHPAAEGQDGQAQREQAPAGAEVRAGRHRRRLRVLVHGLRQVPGVPAGAGEGHRTIRTVAMTRVVFGAPSIGSVWSSGVVFRCGRLVHLVFMCSRLKNSWWIAWRFWQWSKSDIYMIGEI